MGNTGRRKKFGGKNGHFRIGNVALYMHVKHLSIHKLYDYKCRMLCGKVSVATGGNENESWKEEVYYTHRSQR